MGNRLLCCFFMIGLFGTKGVAQVAGFNAIGVHTYPGFLIAHRDDVKNMESHTVGFEFSVYKKNNISAWASNYNQPEVSCGFMFMYLGKPQLTGNVFAILPSVSRKIGQIGYTNLRFKTGTGIGYLTKKFDAYTNRRNQSIGSHLNGAMQLYLFFDRSKPQSPVNLDVGIGITHFSNGSFRVPNLGVNMPSLSLGITSNATSTSGSVNLHDTIRFSPWKFYLAYAFKERSLTKPMGFHIWNAQVVHLSRRSAIKDWRLGGEIFLDKTHHYLDFPGEPLTNLNPLEVTELGIFGGHQWLVNRVNFKIDIGFYAYKPSQNKFFTYQRMGFDYHISDHWFTTFNLKTHFGIADHFTLGIGFKP